jgi:hypothetical protein
MREIEADAFFVDLHKAERDYSPTTMYRDYAINRTLFHWESQSRQTPQQPTVQRYIHHLERGTRVLLFVRERKQGETGRRAENARAAAAHHNRLWVLGRREVALEHDRELTDFAVEASTGRNHISVTWLMPRPRCGCCTRPAAPASAWIYGDPGEKRRGR